jgi:hypothetical protein
MDPHRWSALVSMPEQLNVLEIRLTELSLKSCELLFIVSVRQVNTASIPDWRRDEVGQGFKIFMNSSQCPIDWLHFDDSQVVHQARNVEYEVWNERANYLMTLFVDLATQGVPGECRLTIKEEPKLMVKLVAVHSLTEYRLHLTCSWQLKKERWNSPCCLHQEFDKPFNHSFSYERLRKFRVEVNSRRGMNGELIFVSSLAASRIALGQGDS